METAIVAVICIALIMFGGLTLSQGFLASVDSSSMSLEEIGTRDANILRTEISVLSATWQTLTNTVEAVVRNTGQVKLANFQKWDVIAQYFSETTDEMQYLRFTADAPESGQWTKEGIYQCAGTGAPERFDPGILNPGEEMIITARLDPDVGTGTTNLLVISTPNGVSATRTFIGPE